MAGQKFLKTTVERFHILQLALQQRIIVEIFSHLFKICRVDIILHTFRKQGFHLPDIARTADLVFQYMQLLFLFLGHAL